MLPQTTVGPLWSPQVYIVALLSAYLLGYMHLFPSVQQYIDSPSVLSQEVSTLLREGEVLGPV